MHKGGQRKPCKVKEDQTREIIVCMMAVRLFTEGTKAAGDRRGGLLTNQRAEHHFNNRREGLSTDNSIMVIAS